MKAIGINHGLRVEFVPIETVGLPAWKQYVNWVFKRRRAIVLEPFMVPRPTGGYFIIPGGFNFDGGSIPRWQLILALIASMVIPLAGWAENAIVFAVCVALLLDSFGLMLLAFAVHDFAVRYGLLIRDDGTVEEIEDVIEANRQMRLANFATNDMKWLTWVVHIGVSLGAWLAWRKYRKDETTQGLLQDEWKRLWYGVELKTIERAAIQPNET